MPIELIGSRVRVVERSAGEFELPAGLERDGAAAVGVIEADEIAAIFDPIPTEPVAHALEERADPPLAAVGDG